MFIINCACCKHPLKLPDDAAGKMIRCLKCKTVILIPKRSAEDSNSPIKPHTTVVDDEQPPKDTSP
jgi:LSD1 subclass zinc finger protein